MEEVLGFFRTYETFIYFGLGLVSLFGVRKFAQGWEEVRGAGFGLERERAQARLNRAALFLLLILVVAMVEFILVSFVVPSVPGANPLLTPTIDLLATPTYTLPVTTSQLDGTAASAIPSAPLATADASGCIPGQLTLSSPSNGGQISGKVVLTGTVDLPNFGFYKYEVARPGDAIWLTLQAGREVKHEASLGEWDTHTFPPGDYILRLVASDNQGNTLGICAIQVRVNPTANP